MYLECCSCQATPTVEEWREYNLGAEALGLVNVPEEGFESEEEWNDFQDESGTRLDCPECGEVNCIEDLNLY